VTLDGMQYDLIQSQGHVMGPWKLEILPSSTAIFAFYNGSWQLTTDSQYLNLIFGICSSFCVTWFEIGRNVRFKESTVSPVRG